MYLLNFQIHKAWHIKRHTVEKSQGEIYNSTEQGLIIIILIKKEHSIESKESTKEEDKESSKRKRRTV